MVDVNAANVFGIQVDSEYSPFYIHCLLLFK